MNEEFPVLLNFRLKFACWLAASNCRGAHQRRSQSPQNCAGRFRHAAHLLANFGYRNDLLGVLRLKALLNHQPHRVTNPYS